MHPSFMAFSISGQYSRRRKKEKEKTVNEGYICDGEGWIVSNIISDLSEPSLWLHSCLPLALVTATTARMGKERKKKRKLFL
jgi:hypothetical protein